MTTSTIAAVVCLWAVFTLANGATKATDGELQALTEKLLSSDSNSPSRYVKVNYQGHTTGSATADKAPAPLLTVDPSALRLNTVARLRLLYNNYIADTFSNEHVTPAERTEESSFLDAILATPVMQNTHRFLHEKGYVGRSTQAMKTLLSQLWFGLFSRGGGRLGSSSFEHVFLGELKRGEVSGLHNWLFFGNQESVRKADYLGYIKKLQLGNKGALLKHHFKWSGSTKPVGTMFVGTSPELEMALYTLCFLTRPDTQCPVSLANKKFNIITHTFKYRGQNYIGSAYPQF